MNTPLDEREVCPHCGKKAWKTVVKSMPNNISPYSQGCSVCGLEWHENPNTTKRRPMTAREFAKFVGYNMGKYLYKGKDWSDEFWVSFLTLGDCSSTESWLYAHNTNGELEWRELPEVEG